MKAFVATSLKNTAEAIKITSILEDLGIEHQCCITEIGCLEGEELFEHYVKGISNSDLFISIQKNLGRDTSVEIGIAYALGKKRLMVVYDSSSATPQDSMVYYAAGERTSEDELPNIIKKIKSDKEKDYLLFHQPNLRKYSSKFVKSIVDSLEQEIYVDGKYTKELERVLAEKYKRLIMTTSSGTSGLILSLDCILNDKKEVLVPSLTFPATIQAILYANAKPVFVDVDENTWTIDVKDLEKKINRNTGAILPVHLFGNPCNVKDLAEISNKYKIPIIYDSCQAMGSKINNVDIGSFGKVEVFSLDSTKIVSGGLGGFITISDEDLLFELRKAKNFGIDDKKEVTRKGLNARITEFSAALALHSYVDFEENISLKKDKVSKYIDLLKNVGNINFQEQHSSSMSSYQMFGILINGEEKLTKNVALKLNNEGLGNRIYMTNFMHKDANFKGDSGIILPVTDRIGKNIICLPIHNGVTDYHIEKICKIIKRAVI